MKTSFTDNLKKILIILSIFLFCFLISFIFVWPLWKFSTSSPKIYTIFILIVAAILLGVLLFIKIKKTPAKKTITFLSNFVIIITGLIFSIYFLDKKRFISLIVIILVIAFEILLNKIILKKIKNETNEN